MLLTSTLLNSVAVLALSVTAANEYVVVSSKIDTEGGVLGNIIKQVLEVNDIAVENRIQLGGTPIVRQAITAGEIDIYPEYTGNAAFFFEKAGDPLWNDAALAYAEAAKLDFEANNLNTFSEFGVWVAGGGEVKLAASAEFENSPAVLPKFEEVYGFTLTPEQLITPSDGGTATTIAAAVQQTMASMPPWSMAPMAALRPPASRCLRMTRACSPRTSLRRSSVATCSPSIRSSKNCSSQCLPASPWKCCRISMVVCGSVAKRRPPWRPTI